MSHIDVSSSHKSPVDYNPALRSSLAGNSTSPLAQARERTAQLLGLERLTISATPTFGAAVERYVREVIDIQRTASGARDAKYMINANLLPKWGDRPLDRITKAEIKAFLLDFGTSRPVPYTTRSDGRQARANSIFWLLKAFFKWCADSDDGAGLLDENPTTGLRQPFKTGERDRYLTGDEIRWFWQATGEEGYPYGDIARLLLLTGQRRSEIANMEQWQIDRADRMLCLPIKSTKAKRAHLVPLSDRALEIIDAVPARAGSPTLFSNGAKWPIASSYFSDANRRIAKRMLEVKRQEISGAGGDPGGAVIPGWEFRDLRRTAATVMCRLGHPLEVADKILNHGGARTGTGRTLTAVAQIYVKHEYLPERRAALQALGEFVAGLVSGRAPD